MVYSMYLCAISCFGETEEKREDWEGEGWRQASWHEGAAEGHAGEKRHSACG